MANFKDNNESNNLSKEFGGRLLTLRELCGFLNVSKDYAYRNWRDWGGFKLGGQIRFTEKRIAEKVNEYASM